MIHSKMKRLMAYTSKSRFIRYLRGMGMVIGEYTEFAVRFIQRLILDGQNIFLLEIIAY